jgi:hypothetical protein
MGKSKLLKLKIYRAWSNMKSRCDNPKASTFDKYGGRGIKYDTRWKKFSNFYEDMIDGYEDNLSLERINVNGDYTKENCKWVSVELQARNKRRQKNNTSGFNGVKWNNKKDGFYAVAFWREYTEDGKTKLKNKHFSVKKFGLLPAFAMACKFREDKIKELNSVGYSYGEFHGK